MKLYVGNLSPQVNDAVLRRLFAPYGKVCEAEVIRDEKTSLSRGFAFVVMEQPIAARSAMNGLHGGLLGGRDLMVREAHPKESRTGVYRSPKRLT